MASAEEKKEQPIVDVVVPLLNLAQTSTDGDDRLRKLMQVQELIIERDPDLLDNFLDEILAFMSDRNVSVRKFVVGFIEAACKKDADTLPKSLPNLTFMLRDDEDVRILKRIVVSATHLFPITLAWVAKSKTRPLNAEQCWENFSLLKGKILNRLDSDNDGIRTTVIKFIENLIIAESLKTVNSEVVSSILETPGLEVVPRDHRFLSYRKLESEGKNLLEILLKYMASSHITSINLQTCMNSLTNVARQRPEIALEKVVIALETLHVNLPPTLAKSQVTSVRKCLKLCLLNLLRHSMSGPYHPQITTLLTDLGATQQQVLKALPQNSELKRRMRKGGDDDGPGRKRPRDDVEDDFSSAGAVVEEDVGVGDDDDQRLAQSAIDVTAEWLVHRLAPLNVTDLVLESMMRLPEQMPPTFQSSYTPIAAAGTEGQVKHLARLMATQLTAHELGPGFEQQAAKEEAAAAAEAVSSSAVEEPKSYPIKTVHSDSDLVGHSATKETAGRSHKAGSTVPVYGVQTGVKTSKRFHQFGLAYITRPLEPDQVTRMMRNAFDRILNNERRAVQGGVALAQQKLLIRLVTRLNRAEYGDFLEAYILADQKQRSDVAVQWVYEQYVTYQGYRKSLSSVDERDAFERYDTTLCRILHRLLDKGEHKETLFHKLLLEAPHITPNAMLLLKQACMDSVYGNFGMTTLREMILTRPKQRSELLSALLEYASYERSDLRIQSLETAKELYHLDSLKPDVREYVRQFVKHVLEETPPSLLFGPEKGRAEAVLRWEESTIRACLQLFLTILPLDHSLIHDLADVYTHTSSEVKRVILRLLEQPLKMIGMRSNELLHLVQFCPEGAETLVTRIVHLLTERNPPTTELVEKVVELHKTRVPDVRCLIPVLTGLPKIEIIAALPKMIKLNQNVVKEVFNRLLFGKGRDFGAPMTAAELLVVLHELDTTEQADLVAVLGAMNILFAMRHVYTKEVLSTVVQALIEIHPLPPLLLRTIYQAYKIYPALMGFVINILQRLISKQVWQYPKLWDGFVKSCREMQPQSFQVVLQLPPPQLTLLLDSAYDLKRALQAHIASLPQTHQSNIPPSIFETVMGVQETSPSVDEDVPNPTQEAAQEETTESNEML